MDDGERVGVWVGTGEGVGVGGTGVAVGGAGVAVEGGAGVAVGSGVSLGARAAVGVGTLVTLPSLGEGMITASPVRQAHKNIRVKMAATMILTKVLCLLNQSILHPFSWLLVSLHTAK